MKGLKIKEEMASADEMVRSEEDEIAIASEELVGSIRPLIEQAKARVAQSVNSELVMLYWQIGKRIGEDLHSQYLLSFTAAPDAGARFHSITVAVPGRPGAKVRTSSNTVWLGSFCLRYVARILPELMSAITGAEP